MTYSSLNAECEVAGGLSFGFAEALSSDPGISVSAAGAMAAGVRGDSIRKPGGAENLTKDGAKALAVSIDDVGARNVGF